MANAFRYKHGKIVNSLKSNVTVYSGGNAIEVVALWDTGATVCCVSEKVIDDLSLVPTGQLRISTPSSSDELVNTYMVDLMLPNDMLIQDVPVAHSKIGAQNIGLLIGMNIISQGDFLITNTDETVFSFRMPPEPLRDFVSGINFKNIINSRHSKNRPYKKK